MVFSLQTNLAIVVLTIVPIAISLWLKKSFFWSIKNRHVVITGGSSDIGLWIAIRCIKMGAHVTLLGRNTKKLDTAVEKIKLFRTHDKQMIQTRSIDLSKSYDEVSSLLSTLETEIAPIYWLVNCAGGEMYTRHIDIFPDDAIYLMNVKYYAVYYPTRYVLAQMQKRGEGKITITGSQAKELVLEQYGHNPINFDIWKRTNHGLADIINAKDISKNVSITLVFTDAHEFDHTSFEDDHNRVHIISDRNAPKSEDIAGQIVSDSLNGKRVSILGWENWINLIVWKFTHSLQTVLQNLRRLKQKKRTNASGQATKETARAQPSTKLVDILSSNSSDTEPNANEPCEPNQNVDADLNVSGVAAAQSPADQASSSVHDDLMVKQEDTSSHIEEERLEDCAIAAESNLIGSSSSENGEEQVKNSATTLTADSNIFASVPMSLFRFSDNPCYVESKSGPGSDESDELPPYTFGPDYDKPASALPTEPLQTARPVNSNYLLIHETMPLSTIPEHPHSSGSSRDQSDSEAELAAIMRSSPAEVCAGASALPDSTSSTVQSSTKQFQDYLDEVSARNKADKEKPPFSFIRPDGTNLFADYGAKPVKTDQGMSFAFNADQASDTAKPFMFEAKPMENPVDKSTRESINAKSKLPTMRLASAKRASTDPSATVQHVMSKKISK